MVVGFCTHFSPESETILYLSLYEAKTSYKQDSSQAALFVSNSQSASK